jgi:hypothetical protein
MNLFAPPPKVADLRRWCDLQYAVLGLAEYASGRMSWVWSETPPPGALEESSNWPGRLVELKDAAAPVLRLLDDPPEADWAALEHEVGLLHGVQGEDGEVLSQEDLARMIERAWVAMRAIGSPVPPEEINITSIPATRRALDVVTNWIHHPSRRIRRRGSFVAPRAGTSDDSRTLEAYAQSDAVRPVSPNTIVSLGDRVYMIGSTRQMVNDTEDNVLQAFLGDANRPAVFRLPEPDLISRSGVNDPMKVLRGLQKKYGELFNPALDPPPTKGAGWGVRIIQDAQ